MLQLLNIMFHFESFIYFFCQGINISNVHYKLIWIMETNLKFTDIRNILWWLNCNRYGEVNIFLLWLLCFLFEIRLICLITKMYIVHASLPNDHYINITFYINSPKSCIKYRVPPSNQVVNNILLYSLKLCIPLTRCYTITNRCGTTWMNGSYFKWSE